MPEVKGNSIDDENTFFTPGYEAEQLLPTKLIFDRIIISEKTRRAPFQQIYILELCVVCEWVCGFRSV